jgi:peptidoglycan/xylan/chitin deacetylase (PgdA/CDA1 family)
MYHFIFESELQIKDLSMGDRFYGINVSEFIWQMNYLKNNGYQALLLSHYLQKRKENTLPGKYVIITFDDGHLSTYTLAYPILKEAGFPAEIFVVTGFIGKNNYMSWDHLRELDREGFSIQSHTSFHPFLTDLTYPEIWEELKNPKIQIENNIGKPCRFFCPPGGRYNKIIESIAGSIGYEAVCTSSVGYNNLKSNSMALRRFPIMLHTTRNEFRNILNRDYNYLVRLYIKYYLLKLIKNLLGNTLYNRIREKVLILIKKELRCFG